VPQLSTAVWVGYPDSLVPMTDVGGIAVSGGTYPARIFARYMKPALANVDVQDLFTASPDDLSLHRLDAVPTLPTTSTPSSSSTSSTTTMPPAVIEGQAQPPEPQQPPPNQNQPQYQQNQAQQFNSDNRYRETQRSNETARITSFARERDGYRVGLDRGRSYWVPESRGRGLRVGLSINLGSLFGYPAGYGYENGYVRGVVDRVDYRTGTVWLQDDRSGAEIRAAVGGYALRDLHRGEFVELNGQWIGGGVFDVARIASIR